MGHLPRLSEVLEEVRKVDENLSKLQECENIANSFGYTVCAIYIKEMDKSVMAVGTPEEVNTLCEAYNTASLWNFKFLDFQDDFVKHIIKSEVQFYFEVFGDARTNPESLQEVIDEIESRKFIEKINSLK